MILFLTFNLAAMRFVDFKTADLSDVHREGVQVADDVFRSFGLKTRFCGEVVTVKVFEDNVLVKRELEQPGSGKVLVVDGGGSRRVALMGDQLAALALENGWEGVVIYGCIRDSADINAMKVGVRALGTHPFKSVKRGEGSRQQRLDFAGVAFRPGAFLYADEDGILLTDKPLHEYGSEEAKFF